MSNEHPHMTAHGTGFPLWVGHFKSGRGVHVYQNPISMLWCTVVGEGYDPLFGKFNAVRQSTAFRRADKYAESEGGWKQ